MSISVSRVRIMMHGQYILYYARQYGLTGSHSDVSIHCIHSPSRTSLPSPPTHLQARRSPYLGRLVARCSVVHSTETGPDVFFVTRKIPLDRSRAQLGFIGRAGIRTEGGAAFRSGNSTPPHITFTLCAAQWLDTCSVSVDAASKVV